jgi:hypothetical protein
MRPLPPLQGIPRNRLHFRVYFGTDEKCRAHVFRCRFPNGLTCKCGSTAWHLDPHHAVCRQCEKRVSFIVGTPFQGTRHRLIRWFTAAFYLLTIDKLSAKRLARLIAVTYKTAWTWGHKIRRVQADHLTGARMRAAPRPCWPGSRLTARDFRDPDGPLPEDLWHRFEAVAARFARLYLGARHSRHLSDKHLHRYYAEPRIMRSRPLETPVGCGRARLNGSA